MSVVATPLPENTADKGTQFIDDAYDALSKKFGFQQREEQVSLSKEVYHALSQGRPLCAEAPTGTGKTLAYLIGGLAASQSRQVKVSDSREKRHVPIVISTDTVTLQEQILDSEIKALHEVGLIDKDSVAIAKGRRRYFCPFMAQKACGYTQEKVIQHTLFDDEFASLDGSASQDAAVSRLLFNAWKIKEWNGELDAWPGGEPAIWSKVHVSRETCVTSRCWAYPDECPFYSARDRMKEADVVIANHSLVLSDLSLRNEGTAPLIPFEAYYVVFDEGHHLPETAIHISSTSSGLLSSNEWLRDISNHAEVLSHINNLSEYVFSGGWYRQLKKNDLSKILDNITKSLLKDGLPDTTVIDIEHVPEEAITLIGQAASEARSLIFSMRRILKGLNDLTEMGQKDAEVAVPDHAYFLSRLEFLSKSLQAFVSEDILVRWVEVENTDTTFDLHVKTSPYEGDSVLQQLLWESDNTPIVISATLRSLGSFKRFLARSGAPEYTTTVTIPPSFPYDQNSIIVPTMRYDPTEEEYVTEVTSRMPQLIRPEEGTLMIFTSHQLLKTVYEKLPDNLKAIALPQFKAGKSTLLREHKDRIDRGEGSLLLGVNSFAEGLDLPDQYCTHLIITRIPFTRPDTPVERARQQRAGDHYFTDFMLPDAFLRLLQTVGRLMRRESDRGRITILDKRIVTKRYGRSLLDSLPPFKRKISPAYKTNI